MANPPTEIEQKFLVPNWPVPGLEGSSAEIRQGYFAIDAGSKAELLRTPDGVGGGSPGA